MTPETQQTETPKPQSQQQPAEAPQAQSLLDRIVSEGQVAQRDAIIVKRAEFDQKQRLAKMFANSGCFQDIDKNEQGEWLPQDVSIARAMVKIELGESMGFSAAESVTGIDIIKGRVAVGASLRGARMQRAGFSWPQMIVTDKGCWMPLCLKGEPMMCPKVSEDGIVVVGADGQPVMVQVVVAFTEKDAKMLGLLDKNGSMYKKDPSSMYFARTMTRAQRRYGPGVLGVDVLDTYEARDIPADRQVPAFNIDQFKPSADPNRGHDNAAAEASTDEVKSAAGQTKEPLSPAVVGSITDHLEKQEQKLKEPDTQTLPLMPTYDSWEAVKAAFEGDEYHADLGKIIGVGGKTFTRETFESTWSPIAPNIPLAKKRNSAALDFGGKNSNA